MRDVLNISILSSTVRPNARLGYLVFCKPLALSVDRLVPRVLLHVRVRTMNPVESLGGLGLALLVVGLLMAVGFLTPPPCRT